MLLIPNEIRIDLMIVIVAGMQRSGSTFSFNVVRELLSARGGVSVFSTNSLEEALQSERRINLILKTHAPDRLTNLLLERNAFPCICTIRKPEDAIASWVKVFGFSLEESLIQYKTWLAWHRNISKHVLNISYDEIEKRPLLTIIRIGHYLTDNMRFHEAVKIWWRFRKSTVFKRTNKLYRENDDVIDIGFSYYDKNTFFHRRHVSSLGATLAYQFFTQNQIAFIRQELNEYVDTEGNYFW